MIRISRRDIHIGDILVDSSGINIERNEVINVNLSNNTCELKNLDNGNTVNLPLKALYSFIESKEVVFENEEDFEKFHEFSPVNMTGHYRTVGD